MPHFIDCDDCWVNLDYVAKIGWQQCRDPGLLFYGTDGRIIGTKTDIAAKFSIEDIATTPGPGQGNGH